MTTFNPILITVAIFLCVRCKCDNDFVADDDFDDGDVGGGDGDKMGDWWLMMLIDGDDDVADVGFDGDKGRVNGRLVVDAGLESSRLTLT